jgi:hypothetical protein
MTSHHMETSTSIAAVRRNLAQRIERFLAANEAVEHAGDVARAVEPRKQPRIVSSVRWSTSAVQTRSPIMPPDGGGSG